MSKTHANRMIDAVGVAGNLTPIGVTSVSESQARPLVRLAPQEQREAWSEAVTTAPNGKPTAKHVEAVAARYITRPSLADVLAEVPPPCGPGYDVVLGDAEHLPFLDRSFDLVFGSPPYPDARLYLEDGENLGIARGCGEWIAWMLRVTEEALRVSRGLVCWVVGGKTEGRNYQPGPEGLLYEWCKRGRSAYRPFFWQRPGIPGSGGDQWYASRVEYVLAFKRPGPLPWAVPLANGHEPVYGLGGPMSYRNRDGSREYHRGYRPPPLANPGNLYRTGSGKNHLGSELALHNEAPFPEDLAAWFIRSHCPPGGLVLDAFGGSGTTVAAALKEGRRGVSLDLTPITVQAGPATAGRIARRPGPALLLSGAPAVIAPWCVPGLGRPIHRPRGRRLRGAQPDRPGDVPRDTGGRSATSAPVAPGQSSWPQPGSQG
jgi:hypothetical protein